MGDCFLGGFFLGEFFWVSFFGCFFFNFLGLLVQIFEFPDFDFGVLQWFRSN